MMGMVDFVMGALRVFCRDIFSEGRFQPAYFCLDQSDTLIWTMWTGNMMMFVTHMIIPLIMFTQRFRRSVDAGGSDVKIPLLRLMLAAMIMLCGLEHLMSAINLWHGYYWLAAAVKNITGLQSIACLVVFFNISPQNEEQLYEHSNG